MRIDAQKIIVEGDVAVLIDSAQAIGGETARQLSTSQIRNIFGEVRRIEMRWPQYKEDMSKKEKDDAQDAYRQTVLLRPKLAYQARRERGRGVEQLQEVLDPCITVIQNAKTDQDRRLYFDRFVDFFEAILAYHKAAGGN